MEKTVVCLKWGNDPYSTEWVNRLYRGVKRHWRRLLILYALPMNITVWKAQ